MDIIAKLDRARAELDVLAHPFYQRWNAGDLTPGELDRYAGEYRHAVVALADASAHAAAKAGPSERAGLLRHADEEAEHVALWDQFAAAAGAHEQAITEGAAPEGALAEGPLAQTRECAQAWTAGEELLEHLAVLYVVEASQPQISRTKLDGLTRHYGYSEEGPATEYFRVHAERDVEHAREASELIVRLLDESGDADRATLEARMTRRAQEALRGNWRLLDGVEASRER